MVCWYHWLHVTCTVTQFLCFVRNLHPIWKAISDDAKSWGKWRPSNHSHFKRIHLFRFYFIHPLTSPFTHSKLVMHQWKNVPQFCLLSTALVHFWGRIMFFLGNELLSPFPPCCPPIRRKDHTTWWLFQKRNSVLSRYSSICYNLDVNDNATTLASEGKSGGSVLLLVVNRFGVPRKRRKDASR